MKCLIKIRDPRNIPSLAKRARHEANVQMQKKKVKPVKVTKLQGDKLRRAKITCAICCRITPTQERTVHHLIPRSIRKGTPVCMLCKKCHVAVHKYYTNEELAAYYSTLDKLLDAPHIKAYLIEGR